MTDARPEPFWFGDQHLRCFGMLHRPEKSNGRGIVVCNALGFEGLLAYRPFRHLAERLVTKGFTVLRFDYAGTGDSAGGEWEPGAVKGWLDSIAEAIEVVRTRGELDDVQLVGFRMGATLAMLAALEHPGISGLALWVPCQTGKSFVRELVALARLASANRPPQRINVDWFPEDSLEAVGFEFTATTLEDLRTIDIRTPGQGAPAPAVFVMDRDDAPESSDLLAGLSAAGSVVDHDKMSDYLDFVTDDETSSVMPDAALDRLADWLSHTDPLPSASHRAGLVMGGELLVEDAESAHVIPPGSLSAPVREEAVWIDDRLFAIIGRPVADSSMAKRVVLILNTGSVNRAGPGRLHVTLARHWASQGVTVVRVDLGGTGDSPTDDPATENLPYHPDRLADSVDIVNWIRRDLGCEHLTVIGVCSGAYNAFRIGLDRAPVDRVILVNQLIFSLGGVDVSESDDNAVLSANLLSRGFGNVHRWKRLLKGEDKVGDVAARLRELVASGAFSGFTKMAKASVRRVAGPLGPSAKEEQVARELREITEAGVEVVFIFAADEPGSRFVRVMGGTEVDRLVAGGQVKILEIEGGDHVFSPPGSRRRFIEVVTPVLTGAIPASPSTAAATTPDRRS